jgi:hypothetical protein
MKAVLDASALVAYLHDEPESKRVEGVLPESAISAVHLAEVIQKAVAREVAVGRTAGGFGGAWLRRRPLYRRPSRTVRPPLEEDMPTRATPGGPRLSQPGPGGAFVFLPGSQPDHLKCTNGATAICGDK